MRKNEKVSLSIGKRIFKIIKNTILTVLVSLAIVLAYHGIKVRVDMDFIPSVFGHTYLNVLSGSMEPEFTTNDVVVGRKIKDTSTLKVGDIITFKDEKRLVTHRVTEVLKDNTFKTKGDANQLVDDNIVNSEDVVSVVSFIIPKGGYIVAKFQDFTFLALAWGIMLYSIITELTKEYKKSKEIKEKTV